MFDFFTKLIYGTLILSIALVISVLACDEGTSVVAALMILTLSPNGADAVAALTMVAFSDAVATFIMVALSPNDGF